MIFVDANVVVYAVGGPHPLRERARSFFERAGGEGATPLCTSAEVLQELLHVYLPVRRLETLDAALSLVEAAIPTVWPIEASDVRLARTLADRDGRLGARDLLHLACCLSRDVRELHTFDRRLSDAFRRLRPKSPQR